MLPYPSPVSDFLALTLVAMAFVMIFYCLAFIFKQLKKRRHYKVGMYSIDHFNSTLYNVEETSVLDMIMNYYYRPFYYIEIKDEAYKNLLILKSSEEQRNRLEIENLITYYLRKGSRVKVLTTRDKYFRVTIYDMKANH